MRGLSLDDLGTLAFSWLDLSVFVHFVQAEHGSKLAEEIHGPTWSVEAQLAAEQVDLLSSANWQRAGKRSAPRPKRFPRPWEKPKATTIGAGALPIAEYHDWWDSQSKKAKRRKATVTRRLASKKKPPAE